MLNPFTRMLCGALVLASPLTAAAIPHSLTTTLTADNHYAIYLGREDGSDMRYWGARNELGPYGDGPLGGRFNWSEAETWTFDYKPKDYLYVVTWSDDRVAQGWLGQFQSAAESFLTGVNQGWQYVLGHKNLNDYDAAPDAAELGTLVAPAVWADVFSSREHGVRPWGFIAGVSGDADWIWGTPTMNEYGSGEGEYQVFRRRLATIPEPGTLLLAMTAIGGLAFMRRRRQALVRAAG